VPNPAKAIKPILPHGGIGFFVDMQRPHLSA
jgi:hypothetical protein